jgi:serine/threonine protein kinase
LNGDAVAIKMYSGNDRQTLAHLLHEAELSCSMDDDNVVRSHRYIIHKTCLGDASDYLSSSEIVLGLSPQASNSSSSSDLTLGLQSVTLLHPRDSYGQQEEETEAAGNRDEVLEISNRIDSLGCLDRLKISDTRSSSKDSLAYLCPEEANLEAKRSRSCSLLESAQRSDNELDTQIWLIQEYCDGGTLHKAIENMVFLRYGDSKVKAVIEIALDIARGLKYIHENDVIHCDLSSSNVMLKSCPDRESGFVAKIIDFGRSRQLLAASQTVITGTLGTVTHMSPEMMREGCINKSSDIYSFGVIFWEMWNGEIAWRGIHPVRVIYTISQGCGLIFPEDMPAKLRDIGESMIQNDKIRRPSAADLVDSLEQMLRDCC